MSLSFDAILTELLARAESEPFGLAVSTTNAKALQYQLANLQRALGSNRRHPVIACLPSTPDTVFLVKRSVELI
jgi:hypothetical protein